jgi:hypothetical protein
MCGWSHWLPDSPDAAAPLAPVQIADFADYFCGIRLYGDSKDK